MAARIRLRCVMLAATCSLLVAAAGSARADEPPYLDFVHSLQERGYTDLALEYLLKLQSQTPPVPEEIKNTLPLEIARCRKDLIAREQNSDRRAQLLRDSRADLEAFVKNTANAKHPALPDLELELALLSLDEGRRQIAKAQTTAEASTRNVQKAEGLRLLDESAVAFEKVAKAVEQQLKDLPEPKNKKDRDAKQRLQTAFMNAELNSGIASLEKSIHMSGDVKVAGAAQQKAQKILDDLSNQRDQNAVGWIATAWLFRASIGLDNSKVETAYRRIMEEKKPEVIPAQRLVRYFVMLELQPNTRPDPWRIDAHPKTPFKETNIRTLAESWLKDYPKDVSTPEGQHVRFLLAEQYLAELQRVPAAQRQSTASRDLMEKALRLFEGLSATPGEFAREAENGKFQVILFSGQARTKKIEELRTFEECLLRARIEVMEAIQAQGQYKEAVAKSAEQTKLANETADANEQAEHNKQAAASGKEAEAKLQEMRGHIQDMLKSARRSQSLMPENVKDKEHDLAYQLLFSGYSNNGDAFRAAVICDFLAQHGREPDVAKEYAVKALKIYQSLAGQDPIAARRLVAMAELMERKWPNDLETDTARDILGRDLMVKKQYREAAAMLEKISTRHPAYATCSQYAGICWWVLHMTAMREAKKPTNTPSPERDKAVAALERSVKKYEEQKDGADKKREIQARLYLADEVYNRLGEYEKVLAQLAPLLTMVEKKDLPADVPPNSETRILSLALKAHVQKKDIDGAKRILEALKKRSGADDAAGAAALTEQLFAVGKQIRSQIAVLEAQGEGARDQLLDMKSSFREFLKELEKDAGLTPELRTWVASSYAILGDHDKAIALFATIKDPGDKAPTAVVQNYHAAMLQKLIAERQQAAATKDPAGRRKLFDQAEKDLNDLMKNAWAKKHPSFQKEQVMQLQDQELYSGAKGAIIAWSNFLKSIERVMQLNEVQQNPARLKSFQEHYFDASYNLAYCMYREAKQIANKQKSDEAVKKAAERFNLLYHNENLTTEYKSRIEQFVQDHRDLKKEFDTLNSRKAASG